MNMAVEGLLSVKQPVLMSKPLTIRYIPELGWFEYITRYVESLTGKRFTYPIFISQNSSYV